MNLKKREVFLLLIIFLFGLFIRVRNAQLHLEFIGDTDRDVLIAKTVAESGVLTTAAPSAYGGAGLLKNSPGYFDFLAFIFLFTRSPENIGLFLTVFSSLSIILSFLIAKEILDTDAGLVSAVITATNIEIVRSSQQVYQPDILATFFPILFFLLFYGFKKRSILLVSLGSALFPLLLHIHYAVFTQLPLVFLFITYWSILQRKKTKLWILPIVLFTLSILSWFLLTRGTQSSDFFSFLFKQLNMVLTQLKSLPSGVWERNRVFSGTFFASDAPFVIVLSIFTIIFSFHQLKKNVLKSEFSKNFFYASILSIFFTILSPFVYSSYFSPYYFLFSTCLGILICFVAKKNQWLKLGLLCLLLTFWIVPIYNYFFLKQDYLSARLKSKKIVEYIAQDYLKSDHKKNLEDGLSIVDKSGMGYSFGWGSPTYWYSFEELTKKNLIAIVHEHNNIRPKVTNPEYYYLICWNVNIDQDFIKLCRDTFAEATGDFFYKDFYFLTENISEPEEISFDENESDAIKNEYRIFRFKNLDSSQ
jgi:hypothetical protein